MKLTSQLPFTLAALLAAALGLNHGVHAAEAVVAVPLNATSLPVASEIATYRLTANDVIKVKVYQEEDLTTDLRISRDGTATFPLLGILHLGGKTVEEATGLIRESLGKDYLVNPQVTLAVTEYAKRRFTVLGQVGKPGSYDFPNEDSVTLLQGIGMAGGFTRLAKTSRVTITRTAGTRRTFSVDVRANNDSSTKQLEILPDDIISVDERTF